MHFFVEIGVRGAIFKNVDYSHSVAFCFVCLIVPVRIAGPRAELIVSLCVSVCLSVSLCVSLCLSVFV